MKNNIFTLKRDQVIEYHQDNYTAKNFNLIGVGNFEHEDLVGFCDKYFGNVPEHPPGYVEGLDSSSKKILPLGNQGFSYLEDGREITVLGNHNFGVYPSYDASEVYKEVFDAQTIGGYDSPAPQSEGFIDAKTAPVFQPNLMLIEGNKQTSTKIGIYYDAPNWFDPEMYVFLLLQRMIGTHFPFVLDLLRPQN